jgi:uncharacterized protein
MRLAEARDRFSGSSGLTQRSSEPNLRVRSTRIDLQRIQEGTHSLVLDGRELSLVIDPEAELTLREFRMEGALTIAAKDCRVRGSLTGILGIACDRCLVRFERSVRSEVDETVVFGESASGRSSAPAERASSAPKTIDLADPLRKAVLLELPIKNLCREDCSGLCPSCGANRNLDPCRCDPRPRDPRWTALEGLSSPPREEE